MSDQTTATPASSTAIVPFDFYGDALQVIPQDDKLWVSVKPICQSIGIDHDSQRKRLADGGRSPWATTVIMTAVAQDGKNRELFCIDLDSLPMWLATIEVSRIKEEMRPKLARYQLECKKVLADRFLRPTAPPPPVEPTSAADALVVQVQALLGAVQQIAAQERRLSSMEREVADIKAGQEQAAQVMLTTERAEGKPPELTTRQKVVRLHRAYCVASWADFRDTWHWLYRELRDRYHFDARVRAENRRVGPLDVIEQEGLMEALFVLASDLLIVRKGAA